MLVLEMSQVVRCFEVNVSNPADSWPPCEGVFGEHGGGSFVMCVQLSWSETRVLCFLTVELLEWAAVGGQRRCGLSYVPACVLLFGGRALDLLRSQRVMTLVQFSPWVSELQTTHHTLRGFLALCQILALHADEPFGSKTP